MVLSNNKMLVVSDLHMSDGGPSDGFRKNEKTFQKILDLAEKNNYKIIVLGDLFDMWHCHQLNDITRRYSATLQRLAKTKAVLILGNHDALLEKNLSEDGYFMGIKVIKEKLVLGKTLFIHGHQFNRLVSFFASVVRFARVDVEKWFPALKKFNDFWIKTLADFYKKTGGGKPKKYYRTKAMDYAASHQQIKRIVIGHQHLPDYFTGEINGKYIEYYNSGSWVNGRQDYLLLDYF